jgi:hypothetical protein
MNIYKKKRNIRRDQVKLTRLHNRWTRKHKMSFLQCQTNSRPHTMGLQKIRERRRIEKQKELWTEGKEGMKK